MARRLMDEHGLGAWTFAFLEAERRLGDCHFRDRVIRIGRAHALDASDAEITDTVLHEIAHALAGPEAATAPCGRPPPSASAPPHERTSTNAGAVTAGRGNPA